VTIAGWPRRIGALFIDWIIAMFSAAAISGTSISDPQANPFWPLAAFFVEVSLITGLLGYSIGKRVFGIRVIRQDGSPIGFPRAVLRTALVCLVIPVLIQSEHQRGLQDVATGSMVARG
jgi:uncharacterized RDD family membrane protein YckC